MFLQSLHSTTAMRRQVTVESSAHATLLLNSTTQYNRWCNEMNQISLKCIGGECSNEPTKWSRQRNINVEQTRYRHDALTPIKTLHLPWLE